MADQSTPSGEDSYYYIDSTCKYTRSHPHPTQNLISLYNLDTIADSVARLNKDGTKGVKLRKSYKAHISDLTSRHVPIATERDLSPIVYAPDREGAPIQVTKFDPTALKYNVSFSKTLESGVPGFDSSILGIGDPQGTKRKAKVKTDEAMKKRRVE